MHFSSRFARRIAARFVPGFAGDLQCSGCGRSRTAVTHLIAGPRVYLCDGCIQQASRQLPPRALPRDGIQCRFCGQFRGKPDVTTVGDVIVCADCLGVMTTILADAPRPS